MESISTIIPGVVESIERDHKPNPRTEAIQRMEAGVRAIQSSDDFKAFLSLASKFWDYSWRNWMLIA